MAIRSLFLALALLSAGAAAAQAPTLYTYQAAEPFDLVQLKYMIQAVRDLDPNGNVFHSDDMRIVQVRVNTQVDDASVRSALAATGVPVLPGTPDLRAMGLEGNPDDLPPAFVVTGDPDADLLRYQQAVQQWNAAHPDQPLSPVPVHLLGE